MNINNSESKENMDTSQLQQTMASDPRELTLHQDSTYQAFVLDSIRIERQNDLEQHRMESDPPNVALVAVFIPVVAVITVFLFLWRISENKKKVRLAMIDKGMDPSLLDTPQDESSRKYRALRWGLFLAGSGLGLLIGFLISESMMIIPSQSALVIFSFTLIFGGAGLVVYNRLASKLEK